MVAGDGYRPGDLTAALWRAALSPLMRVWYRRGLAANDFVPRPEDTSAHACGPRPARILVLGGAGPVMGWGVRCQDLALPGQLARFLAAATGRGIDVTVLVDRELALEHALSALAGRDLRVDAVIVVTGAREAVTLRSPSAWRRDLRALLRGLEDACPPSTRFLLAGTQPIRSIVAFRSAGLGGIAERHGRRLNEGMREVCEREPRAVYAPMPAPTDAANGRYRSPAGFRQWAEVIGPRLAEGIAAGAGAGRPSRRPRGATTDVEPPCESIHCPGRAAGWDADHVPASRPD
ncbi:hypothetical protein ACFDTO_17535 [Microbacteriaceae bacterium 4G12]